jgi:hypothetical protein
MYVINNEVILATLVLQVQYCTILPASYYVPSSGREVVAHALCD